MCPVLGGEGGGGGGVGLAGWMASIVEINEEV